MASRGGEVVIHGLTHQSGKQPNPGSEVSVENHEFCRIKLDSEGRQILEGPVPEDSLELIARGLKQHMFCNGTGWN